MTTPSFPGHARSVRLGAALGLLLMVGGLRAQQGGFPTIPDAPTVPVAPTLPDAAVIREPLQPQTSQEIIEERPSSSHVWVSGHWSWREGRYAWIAGRWEVPPRANLDWVEPRWERKGNGYVLTGGYWRDDGIPNNSPSQVPATAQGIPVPTAPPQQAPAQPNTIVINEPPPPPQPEYIVERPSQYHIWIGGYWGFRAGSRVWVSGHWDLPPRTNVVWVEPRWERRGNGYVFIDGYWRDATPVRYIPSPGPGPGPREVIVVREPPPPRREVIPARPPPGMIWVGGYWSWQGDRHIWIAGHFERPPRAQAVWVQPRWERRGGGYIFIEGSWR